jgi:hypothetical protein
MVTACEKQQAWIEKNYAMMKSLKTENRELKEQVEAEREAHVKPWVAPLLPDPVDLDSESEACTLTL